MAIKNSLGQIIGVIQLINKFNELVSTGDVFGMVLNNYWEIFFEKLKILFVY